MATVCAALLGACGCCSEGPVGAAAAALPPPPPPPPTCCCCLPIRKGAIAIGVFQLIQASLLCAFFMCLWLLGRDYDDKLHLGLGVTALHALCVLKALHNAVDAVCDAGLIVGALAHRRGPLTVWLWATALGLPLTALPGIVAPLAAWGVAIAHVPPPHLDDVTAQGNRRIAAYAAVVILVLGAAQTALSVHFLLVVRRLRACVRAKDLVAPVPSAPVVQQRSWRRPAWEADELPIKVPPSDEDFVDPLAQADASNSRSPEDVDGKEPLVKEQTTAVSVEPRRDVTPPTKRPPTPAAKRSPRRVPDPPPGSPPPGRGKPTPKP